MLSRLMLSLLFLAVVAASPAPAAEAVNPVEIKEWEVPFGGHSRDPFATAAGQVWFVGQRGHYIARLDPSTGAFTRKDLDDRAGPHNLIVGDDGTVWYTGNLRGYIGRYDPGTGALDKIAMPDDAARDPHTMVFDGGQRNIWFTVQGGNMVGRLAVATREVTLVSMPTPRSRPYGIALAPDGRLWVALLGTDKIAEVNPSSLEVTEHDLPDGARPRRIGVASDGRVYYTDYRRGYLGRFDPGAGKVEEWAMPAGAGARPYGMAVDARDRVWFVETGPAPNTFVGFDPAAGEFVSVTPIPSGAGSVRHMHHRAGSVWFGTDENTIGRAVVAP